MDFIIALLVVGACGIGWMAYFGVASVFDWLSYCWHIGLRCWFGVCLCFEWLVWYLVGSQLLQLVNWDLFLACGCGLGYAFLLGGVIVCVGVYFVNTGLLLVLFPVCCCGFGCFR